MFGRLASSDSIGNLFHVNEANQFSYYPECCDSKTATIVSEKRQFHVNDVGQGFSYIHSHCLLFPEPRNNERAKVKLNYLLWASFHEYSYYLLQAREPLLLLKTVVINCSLPFFLECNKCVLQEGYHV